MRLVNERQRERENRDEYKSLRFSHLLVLPLFCLEMHVGAAPSQDNAAPNRAEKKQRSPPFYLLFAMFLSF